MTITVKIDDPATIALLQRYTKFLNTEDECEGTMDQIAEGVILGFLDVHDRFSEWQNQQPAAFDLEPPQRHLASRVISAGSRFVSAQVASDVVPVKAHA